MAYLEEHRRAGRGALMDAQRLFDLAAEIEAPDLPARIPRGALPFPIGETEERHQRLMAQGYTVVKGKCGFTVFRFGSFW